MIISYARYTKMRIEHIDKALGREAKLLMFFLFTIHDNGALHRLKEISSDLHALTGNQCAGILFAPPDPNMRLQAHTLNQYANAEEEADLWKNINIEMTNNTYEIAKQFNIPFEQLPAVLFVSRDNDEYAYLSLRRKSLADLHRSLREIISLWYNQNSATFDHNRNIWRNYVSETIVPLLLLENTSSERRQRDRIASVVKRAKRAADHPGELHLFEQALRDSGINLNINGVRVDYQNIRQHIKEVVRDRTIKIFFPLHEIKQIDRNIQIHSGYQILKLIRDEVAEWTSKLTPFSKFFPSR